MIPPGGPATLYGVLYQLLGSVRHAVRLQLQRRGSRILGARMIVEPSSGGDLRLELPRRSVVEQWKARTTNKPWSLQEIVGKVLPDLYLDPALEDPADKTEYIFATEGHLSESARTFFERLCKPLLEGDPLDGLCEGDRTILRAASEAVRKRKRFRAEPDTLTFNKLRRLLSRFAVHGGQKAQDLAQDIDNWLLPLIDHREKVGATRERLCTIVLSKAAHGEVVIVPEDLLKEVGLRGVSLKDVDELRKRVREVVKREVKRRKYDHELDVRTLPRWPEQKFFLVIAGESGQGKTWQIARVAQDLAEEGACSQTMTVFLVTQDDVARDLEQAADLLWKQAWDNDQFKSLDRVAAHWREVQGHTGRTWLTVCIDNVQSLSRARVLIDNFDWEWWGVRLALAVPKEVGIQLAGERPDQVHLHLLRDFTLPELREYLRRRSRNSEDLPGDVRETLRRPLLAGIYTTIESGPEWKPTREYQIYERYWRWLRTAKELADYPEDLVHVKSLTLSLVNEEEPCYPWTWERLAAAGLANEPRQRLERAGWWVRVDGGVEVWHDRLLSWALAEAVVERGSAEQIANWLRRDRRPENPRIRRILAYLPLDVLWLLSGDKKQINLVSDLIVFLETENKLFGLHGLYEEDIPSLGCRIVPSLIERLRRLPGNARSSYLNRAVTALSKILDREPKGREDLPPLLEDSSRVVRDVAVGALARHPHRRAVDLLWERLRSSSRSIDESHGMKGLTTYQATFPALRACLDLDPSWLRARILDSDPEQAPIWELAYLLAGLKHPAARSIWLEVKEELFRKMPLGKLRSLAVCIRVFLDAGEASRLESWLSVEEDWTELMAFRALAGVAPGRAVQLINTLPSENLSDCHFGSWLPILLLKRPDETRRALRERLGAAGLEFWKIADIYTWYEERMDRETLELLLNQLELILEQSSLDDARNSLRQPLSILSRVHRVNLLQGFEARAGKNLDRLLGDVGASCLTSPGSLDLKELQSVLLKIGGEGIRRLIREGLTLVESKRQEESLFWGGMMFVGELASDTLKTPAAYALLGKDQALVKAIIALEGENPWRRNWRREWLTQLWRLRRGKPPMTDEALAPAFEALGNSDLSKRMQGLDAVAISGRVDLLYRLPQWMEGVTDLGAKDLNEFDRRAAYVVHRLARENAEGVRYLAGILDFRHFPLILSELYGQPGAEVLTSRLAWISTAGSWANADRSWSS